MTKYAEMMIPLIEKKLAQTEDQEARENLIAEMQRILDQEAKQEGIWKDQNHLVK